MTYHVVAEHTVPSRWVTVKGTQWDGKKYGVIQTSEKEKRIHIKLLQGARGFLLDFGGPTGFEMYNIDDMIKLCSEDREEFCICGGTTNSWPECYVKVDDVRGFLADCGIIKA